MIRILYRIGVVVLTLFIGFTGFIYWASSPSLDSSEYKKSFTYNYPSTVDDDSIYSIITYNIGYLSGLSNNKAVTMRRQLFDDNLDVVLRETQKYNADIVALQEVDYDAERSYNVNQETEIAKLGYNHVARGINWDENYLPFPGWSPSVHYGRVVSGQSVLSKYPIVKYDNHVLERVSETSFLRDAFYLERLAQVVMVNIDGVEVVVINVHLEAFDKETRDKQLRYVTDKVFSKYKDIYPTIYLGDFNAPARDTSEVIHELMSMAGIGNAAYNRSNPANTYDSKNPHTRIDYIFYTESTIEYIDGAVLSQYGEASDHLPVAMRFKLK